MKSPIPRLLALTVLVTCHLANATDRYVSLDGGHAPPFLSWADAATNIQDAIDASLAGDTVWVTNGVYNTGGSANRVVLDKALTVRSVNGSHETSIQGEWDHSSTSSVVPGVGPDSVRCAWLASGAQLVGFTLENGSTSETGGGGAYCADTTSRIINCRIRGNVAIFGGGVMNGTLINCAVVHNVSYSRGGGAMAHPALSYDPMVLVNCTVAWNTCLFPVSGAGLERSIATNTICYHNLPNNFDSGFFGSQFYFSCTQPSPTGADNITASPEFISDGIHLNESSPCRETGTPGVSTGLDIDGQPWLNSPSMGCDEWHFDPVIAKGPVITQGEDFQTVLLRLEVAGAEPFVGQWWKDGTLLTSGAKYVDANTTTLGIKNFSTADAGDYSFAVTNSNGTTSGQLLLRVHHVNPVSAFPIPPYTNWNTAAHDIQTAVDFAPPNVVILVTNGTYDTGGKAVSSGLTNRVALTKPLLVKSVNGSEATIIEGQWDPTSTNGPLSVRCAWLAEDAALSGFALKNGSTGSRYEYGGGVCGWSTNAVVSHCLVTNGASWQGGGAYQCSIVHSRITRSIVTSSTGAGGGLATGFAYQSSIDSNRAFSGGGAFDSELSHCEIFSNVGTVRGGGLSGGSAFNCFIVDNTAFAFGGGAANDARLIHCTIVGNTSARGSGIASCSAANTIVAVNSGAIQVYFPRPSTNCCFPVGSSAASATDAIFADPMLVDGYHLAATSPCRGAGNPAFSFGTDFDGEPWLNPPSMGCDEVYESALTGALAVALSAGYPEVAERGMMSLFGEINGRASGLEWNFGDGISSSNLSYLTTHVWTNSGDYTVTFTAYNTDNPGGVSTNLLVHVVPLEMPLLSAGTLTNTSFSLQFPGQPGVSYDIERATNLVPPVFWQQLATRLSDGSVIQYTDTKATNDIQFYRTSVP